MLGMRKSLPELANIICHGTVEESQSAYFAFCEQAGIKAHNISSDLSNYALWDLCAEITINPNGLALYESMYRGDQ